MNANKRLLQYFLENPDRLEWSVQGLGMMRAYFDKNHRLHIWDSSLKIKDASPIHTHPWHFSSEVIVGTVRQHRYTEFPLASVSGNHIGIDAYWKTTIKCGAGACELETPKRVGLIQYPVEIIYASKHYYQQKTEIHQSLPEDHTVTLTTRIFDGNPDLANVYWANGEYVSAEPRPATQEEVKRVVAGVLKEHYASS